MRPGPPGERLPSFELPVEPVRGARPEEGAWRGDALSGSRHSRLADHLLEPLEALDRLHELATRQAAAPSALQGQRARDLAAALSHALVGRPEPKAEALAAALLHLRPLLDEATAGKDVAAELDEIRGLLEKSRLEGAGLPRGHRRAACFLRLAAGRLLGNLQREEARRRTTLGLGTRLALLLRARIAPGS